MSLYVSVNWHQSIGVTKVEKVLLKNGPKCFYSVIQIQSSLGHTSSFTTPSTGRAEVPSPPRREPQESPIEALNTGLIEVQN